MDRIDPELRQKLIDAAFTVRERAYVPYSKFAVGAALVANSNAIHVGCNVENVSLGLTLCAERNAMGAAVAAGETGIRALVVMSPGPISPCGACRQFLVEFGADFPVVLADTRDPTRTTTTSMAELLPLPFNA